MSPRGPGLVSLLGAALAAGLLLWLAGGPLYTDDLWWHLKAGEAYLAQGPWPDGDPLLHTAHAGAPVQHEWLFGAALALVDRAFGLQGLRALHLAWVAALLWLAGSLFARAARWPAAAAAATSAFVALAWWRLAQLRPDLFSIGAALLLYRLLLEPRGAPSWRAVGASLALLVVWANVHSLFAVGLALLVAGLCAEALRAGLARAGALAGAGRVPSGVERARVQRLAAALGLGALLTLLNPRGLEQHLTFFRSSSDAAIWAITDEWIPFSPFDWSGAGFAGNPLSWALVDGLALAFLLCAGWRVAAFLRRPRTGTLEAVDVTHLGLGLAALVAIGVSVRFFWLGAFLLLDLLRHARRARAADAGPGVAWVLAAASLGMALALPAVGGYRGLASLLPASPLEYLRRPYVTGKYYSEGVRFLRDAELRGNLFNHYWMGGFLGYWLAPALRTYVDGRVEHYPPEVLREVRAVTRRHGLRARETATELLERRGVDVFFGVGVPPRGSGLHAGVYSAANLEGEPGWLLISRSIDHALWLRLSPRNRENVRRVADYYAREGVPFDALLGLDPARVLRERPEWAVRHRMLPRDGPRLWQALEMQGAAEGTRFRALRQLGTAHVLQGAYAAGLELLEQASRVRPDAPAPLRARIYAELRLGRVRRALVLAEKLAKLTPDGAREREIVQLVRRLQAVPRSRRHQRAELIDGFPLFSSAEEARLAETYISPLVDRGGVAARAGRGPE